MRPERSAEGSSPSPVRDEGWIGPGGRKFVAVGILVILLIAGAMLATGDAGEDIASFFEELAEEGGGGSGGGETTTLQSTTIDSGEFGMSEGSP